MIWCELVVGVFIVGLILIARKAFAACDEIEADDLEQRRAIIRRANQEHRQAMRGDPRGTYGIGYAARQAYEHAASERNVYRQRSKR